LKLEELPLVGASGWFTAGSTRPGSSAMSEVTVRPYEKLVFARHDAGEDEVPQFIRFGFALDSGRGVDEFDAGSRHCGSAGILNRSGDRAGAGLKAGANRRTVIPWVNGRRDWRLRGGAACEEQ
jgi:hypothetical protein